MIITSLLDLDLYKLTVGEVVFTYFRNVTAKYRMTVRNGEKIEYWKYVQMHNFQPEVDGLKKLSLTDVEATYLRSLNLFSEDYIQFLRNAPMANCFVTWVPQGESFGLNLVPEVSGKWCEVMLYEIFCLSIGNELFTDNYAKYNDISMNAITQTAFVRLQRKTERLTNYNNTIQDKLDITEFGTRRRLSKFWQQNVVACLIDKNLITGTSNVNLARKFSIPVKGTFGHEFTMGMQGVARIQDSQVEAFKLWLNHWKGKLKIALDDTFGEDKFLRDFSEELAIAYDGLRHDSGPIDQWTFSRINMYAKYGIDTKTKTLFYSDGLDDGKIIRTHKNFNCYAKLAFGVGTFLTNDSFTPVPQVVMKIMECNGQPVAKLSNNPEKASCDDKAYLEYIKHVAAKL